MTVPYLESLEENAWQAARTLEGERYYEFTHGLMELVSQAKHYQRIAESLLGQHCGAVTYEQNKVNSDTANKNNDWYRYLGEEDN